MKLKTRLFIEMCIRDRFRHPHFREESRKMLEPILLQLEEYASHPEEYKLLGIISVEGSPSCGYRLTLSLIHIYCLFHSA